jgi:hypothetical protein
MNYEQIYKRLVDRAQTRLLDGYIERHHIVPKCLQGTNDLSNIVSLTPEEHYLAHLLLVKIYPNTKGLWYAVKLMSGLGNNKKYGWVKRHLSEIGFTQKHKDNLSNAQKIKWKNRPVGLYATFEERQIRYVKMIEKRQLRKDSAIITALIYAVS